MSGIDFFCSVDKVKGVDGNARVVITFDGKYLSHTEQVCACRNLYQHVTFFVIEFRFWTGNKSLSTVIIPLFTLISLLVQKSDNMVSKLRREAP